MAFPIVYLKYSEIYNYFPVLKNKIKIVLVLGMKELSLDRGSIILIFIIVFYLLDVKQ